MPELKPPVATDTDRVIHALRKRRANGSTIGQLADDLSMRFGLVLSIVTSLVCARAAEEITADERPLDVKKRVFRVIRSD
jgi:hypothetical protein